MKHCLFLLSLFLLHGCAYLTHFDSAEDRVQLLEQYLKEQEYSKALTLIADTSREDPQALELEKKRKMILKQLQALEQQTISKALKQERNNDWPSAKLTYEEARKKLPASTSLDEAQGAMLKRFRARMDALEREGLIGTGEWLRKRLPLLRSLHESDPGNLIIHWRYSRTEKEAREVGLQLLKSGEQMLAENNLAMAQRILPLVAELSPNQETEMAVSQLNNRLRERKDKKQKDRRKIARKKDEKVIEGFNKAMAHNRLAEARKHLARLSRTAAASVSGELMHERLDNAIAEYVQEEISIGDAFYRAGEYDQAIETWQNAVRLKPDNKTALNKLKRAETIVKKLQILRERQK